MFSIQRCVALPLVFRLTLVPLQILQTKNLTFFQKYEHVCKMKMKIYTKKRLKKHNWIEEGVKQNQSNYLICLMDVPINNMKKRKTTLDNQFNFRCPNFHFKIKTIKSYPKKFTIQWPLMSHSKWLKKNHKNFYDC